jgi:TPR repeat protein
MRGGRLWSTLVLALLACGCSLHETADVGRCSNEARSYSVFQSHVSSDRCVSQGRRAHAVENRPKPRTDSVQTGPVQIGPVQMEPLPPVPMQTDPMQKEISAFMPQATAGNADAAYHVGLIYERYGQQADANDWLTKAAEAGSAPAAMHLGRLLESSDPDAARRWYDDAARHGEVDAVAREAALQEERRSAEKTAAGPAAQP